MKKMSFTDITSNVYDALLLDGYTEEHLELCVDEVKGYIGYKDDMVHETFDMIFEKDLIRFIITNTSNGEASAKEIIFYDVEKFYKYLYKTECIFKYEAYQRLIQK